MYFQLYPSLLAVSYTHLDVYKRQLDAVRKLVTLPTETSMLTAPPAGLFLERVYYGSEEIDKQFQTLL